MNLPDVVTEDEWQRRHEELLAKEKAYMREGDRLAAERRRQPMHEVTKDYRFEGRDGDVSLFDLFEGRRQLALYHFMFGPSSDEGCDGCSMVVDQLTHLAHLHARDTSFVLVSRAPLAKVEAFKRRMGWDEIPWYSDGNSDFGVDFGFSPPEPDPSVDQNGEVFGFNVFIHDDGGRVYRTYFTDRRGVEAIGTVWSILDRTPLGRQEEWEDTPQGRPQGPKFEWWRHHDRYDSPA
ncbi:MAG: DUF899 domain-containing protein [Actinomycetota bacterium]|nr:DUF899 domain-containing protein [Actinomycetota bacterium]